MAVAFNLPQEARPNIEVQRSDEKLYTEEDSYDDSQYNIVVR